MNYFKQHCLKLLILLLVVSVSSCNDDDGDVSPTPPGSDTFEIIAESPDHETLEQALIDTGLDQVLNSGVYTVFAPTDAAFNNIDISGLNNEQLTNVLLNHVLANETFFQTPAGSTQSTFSTGYVATSATEKITGNDNNLNMYINIGDNITINGNATVSAPDLNANNGVVHVVDEVITLPDVTTFAVADPTFDNLEAALTRDDQPDFVGTLRTPNGTDPAPFTVFAPTNAAFGSLLDLLGAESLADIDAATLTATLNNHVIPGAHVRANDLTDGSVGTLEDDITINASEATITDQNGRTINIAVTDVQTANGVVHAIDKVILPDLTSTFDVIAESPDHTTLEQALIDTGLDEVLNNGNFTVFAPTDAAFSNTDLSGLSNAQLTNVLLNHVLSGTTLSSDLSNTYVKTNATEMITDDAHPLDLYINTDAGVTLNGAADVTTPDLEGFNGVVHVTDEVIPMPDITTFAVADPTFNNLQAALTRDDQPDFVGTLSTPNGTDPAPFTVFAPTNTAFGDLLNELGLNNLSEVPQQTLTSTLNSHVIAGANVRADDLTNGTVQSLEAELTIDADNATITDPNGRVSNIIVTDVQTTNGVIHAIDKVILPQQ